MKAGSLFSRVSPTCPVLPCAALHRGPCRADALDKCHVPAPPQSFGTNPFFLPSSTLYDPTAPIELQAVANDSLATELKLNENGVPYGFIWNEVPCTVH